MAIPRSVPEDSLVETWARSNHNGTRVTVKAQRCETFVLLCRCALFKKEHFDKSLNKFKVKKCFICCISHTLKKLPIR